MIEEYTYKPRWCGGVFYTTNNRYIIAILVMYNLLDIMYYCICKVEMKKLIRRVLK